jgi:hypothetical protein
MITQTAKFLARFKPFLPFLAGGGGGAGRRVSS